MGQRRLRSWQKGLTRPVSSSCLIYPTIVQVSPKGFPVSIRNSSREGTERSERGQGWGQSRSVYGCDQWYGKPYLIGCLQQGSDRWLGRRTSQKVFNENILQFSKGALFLIMCAEMVYICQKKAEVICRAGEVSAKEIIEKIHILEAFSGRCFLRAICVPTSGQVT
jgi:hypothetical protein